MHQAKRQWVHRAATRSKQKGWLLCGLWCALLILQSVIFHLPLFALVHFCNVLGNTQREAWCHRPKLWVSSKDIQLKDKVTQREVFQRNFLKSFHLVQTKTDLKVNVLLRCGCCCPGAVSLENEIWTISKIWHGSSFKYEYVARTSSCLA